MKLLKRMICFAILMETDKGILEKSSKYVMDKLQECINLPDPTTILDYRNKRKFEEYIKKWKVKDGDIF